MTSETDAEFVERMDNDWVRDRIPNSDDAYRLFTLARRGAAAKADDTAKCDPRTFISDAGSPFRADASSPFVSIAIPPPSGEPEHE